MLNRRFLKTKFEEKAWTKPRKQSDGSFATALPEDAFKTYEEWENFVIEHEYQHSLLTQEQFDNEIKTKTDIGQYEDEINRRALKELGIKITPAPTAPASIDATTDIEKEKAKITPAEFTELKRLAKFFLENPKEPTVAGSVVTRYPALFKAVTDIERRRNLSLRNIRQSSLNFDAGRDYVGSYNIAGTEIIDSNGKPSGLFKTEIIREDTKEEVEKELNAKYDAELAGLGAAATAPVTQTDRFVEELDKIENINDFNTFFDRAMSELESSVEIFLAKYNTDLATLGEKLVNKKKQLIYNIFKEDLQPGMEVMYNDGSKKGFMQIQSISNTTMTLVDSSGENPVNLPLNELKKYIEFIKKPGMENLDPSDGVVAALDPEIQKKADETSKGAQDAFTDANIKNIVENNKSFSEAKNSFRDSVKRCNTKGK
jgi:hypothetical protein